MTAKRRSLAGLNAANFFQAELVAEVAPFLSAYLREHHWRYDAIGVPLALGALGVFIMQAPAGFLVGWLGKPRLLFALSCILLGICIGLAPVFLSEWWWVDGLLFVAGLCQAFFVPLLGSLAVCLGGAHGLERTIGSNQSWNHLGNIGSALLAITLAHFFSAAGVLYGLGLSSLVAATTVLMIDRGHLDECTLQHGAHLGGGTEGLRDLFRDRRVQVLFASTALFHLANAPVLPMVALYIKHLHGTDTQVALVVLIAQSVMVPVAWLAARLAGRFGRKAIFAVGFLTLPVRILLYSFTKSPALLLAIQSLDGIGAGIYGVAIVLMCQDLTCGRSHFNALMGILATALALGAVIGPLASGFFEQHLGFTVTFYIFAGVAALAAGLFLIAMPETAPSRGVVDASPACAT